MKTFKYYVTYHYEDSGEVQAFDYDSARDEIENNMSYVVAPEGFRLGWDWVDIHDIEEIDDDGEE